MKKRYIFKKLDEIAVPKDQVNKQIEQGKKQYQKQQKRRKRMKWSGGVAVVVLLFLALIRFNPSVADALSKIPVFAGFVELIKHDESLRTALEHEYVEKIDHTITKKDVKMTIQQISFDGAKMVISYRLTNPNKHLINQWVDTTIDEEEYTSESSMSPTVEKPSPVKRLDGVIQLYGAKLKRDFTLDLTVEINGKDEKFRFPIHLTKKLLEPKILAKQQMIELDGQKMELLQVSRYPLTTLVTIRAAASNTKNILMIEEMVLYDGKKKVATLHEGLRSTGSLQDKEGITYYLQGDYFKSLKEPRLVLSSIQALEKGEEKLIVNLKKKQVIKKPNNTLVTYELKEDELRIIPKNEQHTPQIQLYDANGKEVDDTSYRENGVNIIPVNPKEYKQPLTGNFVMYPAYLKGEVQVPLKE
ncbi:MAG: DUF4179 domain-containing protein [Kurthia sp.]|nr:DUF4179 domain-containing protein [Kurthia sp.]